MRTIILMCFLLLPFASVKADYDLYTDTTYSKFQYKWYGASEATFTMDLPTIGYGINHSSGFGSRIAYGKSGRSRPNRESKHYDDFIIGLDSYYELEFNYSHALTNELSLFAGVGFYRQEVPIHGVDNTLVRYDRDDDHGYFTGVSYRADDISILLTAKQTSIIGDGSGKSDTVALGSTMRQIGITVRVYF